MATYRSKLSNYYTDKQESYVSVGSILPVVVDQYTDITNSLQTEDIGYSNPGFLYCDGSEYSIRDYPLLYEAIGDSYKDTIVNSSTGLAETSLNNAVRVTDVLEVGSIQQMFWVNNKLFLEMLNDPTTPGGDKRPYPYSCNLRFYDLGDIPTGIFDTTNSWTLYKASEISAVSATPTLTTVYEVFGVNGANYNQNDFTIDFNLPGKVHPEIRVSKGYRRDDYPFLIGKFRVPDYRERKLIGYGTGVEGGGTPIVENRTTLRVGDVGGKWQIPITRIDDPGAFFDVGDVLTTGYTDVETLVQARLIGEKRYTMGPIEDYVLSRPPEHEHLLLHSRVDDTSLPVVGGGMDTLTSSYTNTNGTVIDFIPEGGVGAGVAIGHSHGLIGQRLTNAFTATIGNVSGIGSGSDQGDCTFYDISQAPPFNLDSASSNGTVITVVTSTAHNLGEGDWITISLAGAPWDGSYEVQTVNTATEFTASRTDPAMPSGTLPGGAIIRQADGVFEPVTSTEVPRAYTIDDFAVIGNKPIIVFQPGDLEERYSVSLPGDGTSFSRTAADAGDQVVQISIGLYGSGGSGANTASNGTTGGNATVTFTLDSTSHTIIAYGGQGGRSGNSGGAGGQGGGVSIPAALLSDDRVTVTQATGLSGGNGGTEQSQGGAGGGQGIGSGGAGEGTSFNYSTSQTYGPYYSSGTTNFSDFANIQSVNIQISGGGGGRGNTNANSGCSSGIGGSASVGRRVVGTFNAPGNFTYYIGQQGAQGFNSQSYGNVESYNYGGGGGAATGGGGGRGALGNGATGGAGGGATGIYYNGIVIMGAGGGGGGGGSGGGSNGGGWDGCYGGTGGVGPSNGLYGGPAIQFANGNTGGISGCTAGGGGGGGAGCGPSGAGSGGSGGGAGAGHGGFGGGSGGAAGRSAYNTTYISAASESGGSSGTGYALFVVSRTFSGYGRSGGGGGQGGTLGIAITDPEGGLSTGISGSLGAPGSGGGSQGTYGAVEVSVNGQQPGTNPQVGTTTAAGRSYRVPGYPGLKDYDENPILTGSAIWATSTDGVDIISASNGTFPVAPSNLHDGKVTRILKFSGEGTRSLTIGPLDSRYIDTMYFDIIVGQGSNGGEKPDENLLIYYKEDIDSNTKTLLDALVPTTVTSTVYSSYSYTIPEDSNARSNSIYFELIQERTANQGDNNDDDVDNFGIAQMVTTFNERTDYVFTPSSNATISGCNEDGIESVTRTVTAGQTNILVSDGTFTLSPSTPISVNASVVVEQAIPLITKYHRCKYLIKAT